MLCELTQKYQTWGSVPVIKHARAVIVNMLSGKDLEMIGHFFGSVCKKIARSAILKCGVSHENLKT